MKLYKLIFLFSFLMYATIAVADEPPQEFQGFNLQGYGDDGKKAWDVKGDTANIVGSEIILSNVDANAYGDKKMNLVAESGVINQDSGNMHLEKDVIITSEDGSQLLTDSLDWSRNEDLVTTEDDVLITDEKVTISGKGITARPGLKTAQIREDVTALVNTEPKNEDGKIVTITSDGPMVIDQTLSVATFQDNVVAVQNDQTLKADRMEIHFDGDMSDIKKIVCIGNVEIIQGENRTYAQRALYDASQSKLILSGRPKLILLTEGENAITSFGNK